MNLITIRPGPVLHVWRDGAEVAAVPLSPSAALTIASDLLVAIAAESASQTGQRPMTQTEPAAFRGAGNL